MMTIVMGRDIGDGAEAARIEQAEGWGWEVREEEGGARVIDGKRYIFPMVRYERTDVTTHGADVIFRGRTAAEVVEILEGLDMGARIVA